MCPFIGNVSTTKTPAFKQDFSGIFKTHETDKDHSSISSSHCTAIVSPVPIGQPNNPVSEGIPYFQGKILC